jgi:predicted enzyme related to lactoylglutathione lyase
MTNDIAGAMRFYAELFGWEYRIEHASECGWTGGEADYPLILCNGQAHGGFVNPAGTLSSFWLAHVRVADVDAKVATARNVGATIQWEPFDVPGVGRNAVIADPMGAVIGAYAPTHDFPPPRGTFVWDALVTDDAAAASSYYGTLFGWGAERTEGEPIIFKRADGSAAAGVDGSPVGSAGTSRWLTYFATRDVEAAVKKALAGGAQLRSGPADAPVLGRCALLADPAGAQFGLIAAWDGGVEVPDV